MWWRWILILLLVACSPQQMQALPAGAVILAFGDSITYGTGAAPGEDYPAQLAALIGHPVINAGVPGETSAQGRERLAATLAEVRPKLVLLGLGGNDFLQRLPAEEAKANLIAMIKAMQAQHIQVVLLAVPGLSLPPAPHPLYAEVAEQTQVPLAEEQWLAVLSKRSLKSDTVHPNAAGYAQFAQAMADFLRQSGAIRD